MDTKNQNTEKILKEAADSVASSDSTKPTVIVKLYDSYTFDGVEIKEIDLSGLYDMTAEDMFAVDEQMRRRGYSGQNPEITRLYALLTAARINHKPWEWCNRMKARDAVRIKNVVSGFFYMPG
ncbi:MAG: phage tail assembly protein [Hungatella sp.]|nr:phage tail assembly protein [Hungatella sp.]